MFPDWFDPSARIVEVARLVAVDTPDGLFRFVIGDDLAFRDVDDNEWIGSRMLSMPEARSPLGGDAPLDRLILSYFHDETGQELAAQVNDLGISYLDGRRVEFFLQPFQSAAERFNPSVSPVSLYQRVVVGIDYDLEGPLGRSIILNLGTVNERRVHAQGLAYNTVGHAQLIGAANPSFQFVPTDAPSNELMFP